MPKPVYMLCCLSGSDDHNTGLPSHFNVIDRLELREITVALPEGVKPFIVYTQPIRIVAVWWAVEDADFETEFEMELRGFLTPSKMETTFFSGKFVDLNAISQGID